MFEHSTYGSFKPILAIIIEQNKKVIGIRLIKESTYMNTMPHEPEFPKKKQIIRTLDYITSFN